MDQFALEKPTLFVIRSQDELESFWTKHAAIFFPQPALPVVDFSQEMIIAVVDKIEPSGGYSLTIESLESCEWTVSVKVRKVCPGPGVMVTDELTVPYHIVQVSLSDQEFVLSINQ
jgi:hypothetical protein